jgi:hypothetical protein
MPGAAHVEACLDGAEFIPAIRACEEFAVALKMWAASFAIGPFRMKIGPAVVRLPEFNERRYGYRASNCRPE